MIERYYNSVDVAERIRDIMENDSYYEKIYANEINVTKFIEEYINFEGDQFAVLTAFGKLINKIESSLYKIKLKEYMLLNPKKYINLEDFNYYHNGRKMNKKIKELLEQCPTKEQCRYFMKKTHSDYFSPNEFKRICNKIAKHSFISK